MSKKKSDSFQESAKDKPHKRSVARWRRQGREIAMQSLYQYAWNQLTLEEAIQLQWLERPADPQAKAFASLLVQGTLENQQKLDELIKSYSQHWQFDRIPRIDLAILRLSLYSLLYLSEIPPIVTIDEAIEISKLYSSDDAWRYINGMLDAIYMNEIKKS